MYVFDIECIRCGYQRKDLIPSYLLCRIFGCFNSYFNNCRIFPDCVPISSVLMNQEAFTRQFICSSYRVGVNATPINATPINTTPVSRLFNVHP